MKKLYILSLLLTAGLFAAHTYAQTVTTIDVPTTLCANESFTLGFTVTGITPGTYDYTAELSDINGNFGTPMPIGTITSSALEDYIYVTIPLSTTLSPTSAYRIRVIPTGYTATLIDNGSNIVINCTTRDYYWTGGSGNWSDLTKWSVTTDNVTFNPATEVPTQYDNVNFDNQSFPSGGQLTIDIPAVCNDFYWEPGTGATNPVIWADYNNPLDVYGDFELDPGVYRDINYLYFKSIKYNVSLNFGDNLLQNDPNTTYWKGTLYFTTAGSWDLNSNITADRIQFYGGGTLFTNSGIITLDFDFYLGSGTINAGTSAFLVQGMSLWGTFNSESSIVQLNLSKYGDNPTLQGNSQIFNDVVVQSGICQINTDNTFNNLSLINGAGMSLNGGTTQTITTTFIAQGAGRSQVAVVNSQQPGTPATLNILSAITNVTADYVSITDNTILLNGAAATFATTNAIDGGNNTNWDFTSSPLLPLEYYWANGAGNWSDLSHWFTSTDSGTTLTPASEGPGPLDNVNFNANSFPASGTLTVDQDVTITNMTWEPGSGATQPAIASAWPVKVTILGNFTLDNGVQRQMNHVIFDSGNGTNLIDMADNFNSWGQFEFRGGGIWSLQSDLITTSNVYFYDGTLNTNNFAMEFYGGYLYGTSPTLNWGSSNVTVRGGLYNLTTPVFNAGTSTFIFRSASRLQGPLVFNNVVIEGTHEMEGDNTFNNLTVMPGVTLRLLAGSIQTVTGTLTLQGSRSNLVTVESFDYGTPGVGTFQVTGATIVADFVSLADNTIDNGLPTDVTATNAVDNLNNTGWAISPIVPFDFYWTGGAGNWSDISHWQTSPDGGNTFVPATDIPGPVDNVFFTGNSFPSGGALTLDVDAHCNNMTWLAGSGSSFPVIQTVYPGQLYIHGSLQFDNGVYRDISVINFESDAPGNTITMADNLLVSNWGDFNFNGSGDWTLQDSLAVSNLWFYDGTFNTNGQPVSISNRFYMAGSYTGTIDLGASQIYLREFFNNSAGVTFNAGTSTFNFNASWDRAYIRGGAPVTFYKVNLLYDTQIDGSAFTFFDLTLSPGIEVELAAGLTQTITNAFTAIGNRSQMIEIYSSATGSPAMLAINTAGGATINVDFLILEDNSLDNGVTTDQVASNALDEGGNTGWDFTTSPLTPLDYYWVGGTGNWSDVSHWATTDGGNTFHPYPPGVVDNVNFTGNSFPAGGVVTLDQPAICDNFIWSDGTFNPTIAGTGNNTLTVGGSLTIAKGVNRNVERIIFDSQSSNQLILNDNRFANSTFEFRGGGTWDLIDSLAASSLYIYEGTFNTNGKPVTLSNELRVDGPDPITLNLGNSIIKFNQLGGYATNITVNTGTSRMYLANGGSVTGSAGGYDFIVEGEAWFWGNMDIENDLTILPGGKLHLTPGNTYTIAGNLNANGTRPLPVSILSTQPGTQATITKVSGTVAANYIILQDNLATGGAVFSATDAIDKGNVTGWNITAITPVDYFWKVATGDWSDVNSWAASADLSVPAGTPPGPADNVIVNAASPIAGGGVMNLDIPAACTNMTWDATASGAAISGDYQNPLTIHGSLTLASGVTTNLQNLVFDSEATGNTINLGGSAVYQNINITFQGNGDWTLADSLAAFQLYLQGGTLNTGGFPLNISNYLNLYPNGPLNPVLNLGSSRVYIKGVLQGPGGAVLVPGTSTVSFTSATLYNDWSFNDAEFTGSTNVYGNNTFNNLTLLAGAEINLQAGSTQTVTQLTAAGERARPITIKSLTEGTQATILQAGGVVGGNYLVLQDNNALGGASFTAQNSIDDGNVTGWNIVPISPRTYFWVGGSGNWSDAKAHWANADGGNNFYTESPGPLDDVFFTANSFPSDGTLTLDYPAWVNNMDWSGNTSQVSISDNGDRDNTLTISGSLTLANGVSRDFERLIFKSDNVGNTIFMADNLSTRNWVEFRGKTGEWTLTGPYEAFSTQFLNGTFITNGNDFTSRYIWLYDDCTTFWGSSTVNTYRFYNLLDNSATFNAETSTFQFTEPGNNLLIGETRFYLAAFNGSTRIEDKNIFFNAVVNAGTLTLNDNQAFNTLTMTAGTTLKLGAGTTQTVSDALNLSGSINDPVAVNSSTEGEAAILSAPATCQVSAVYVHLQDNTATGGADFTASNSSDFGNVTGWNGLLTGQTIDFAPLNDQLLANGNFNVAATASSSLPVSFEIASGNATVSGSTVTPGAAGLIGIRAVQTGDATYGSAKPLIRYVHIDATTEPNELGNMKEARMVLGQPDAVTSDRIYTDITLPNPYQTAVLPFLGDASAIQGMLAVANGTRVMLWFKMPTDNTTPADVVLGQADFTTDISPGASASSFDGNAYSIAFGGGYLFVADNSRVLAWTVSSTMQSGEPAAFVIGQSDFSSTSPGTSKTQFGNYLNSVTTYDDPAGNTKLIVTDGGNNRVLIYSQLPTTNGAEADVVIGQSDFTSSGQGSGADQMYRPISAAVTPDGKLLVADVRNNRVLVYNTIPATSGVPADLVLGQPGFGLTDPGTDSTSFNFPISVSVSKTGKLAIADYFNHRVLVYNSVPTNNTTAPDYILGQPDATSNTGNYNSISGRSLLYPISADWDISENLFVADNGNNRILVYGAADFDAPAAANATYPTTIIDGTATSGEITLTDRSGIIAAELHYSGISTSGGNTFTNTIPLTRDAGTDIWRFDVSGAVPSTEKLGVVYYLTATDALGNVMDGSGNKVAANIQYNGGLPITNFGVGNQQNQYRMLAVPLNLTNKDANAVFDEITSGTYDKTKFRIFAYPGGTGDTYTEYGSGFTNIELGTGYFALAASSAAVMSGEGVTPSGVAANPVTKVLVPGWNMIGNPYNFTVLWSDVLSASGITNAEAQPPQGYNGNFVEQTTIAAGEGVFVNNPTSNNVTLIFPVMNNSGGRIEGVQENDNPLSESSWEVRFLHQDDKGYEVVLGAVGMEEGSEYSFDEYDRINPPAFARQPRVEFSHPEFFQPSFKKDIRGTASEEMWRFTYTAEASETPDEIYWDNSYFGVNAPDIYLVDKTHFEVVNMKEQASYSFDHGGVTKFEVYFGDNALANLLPDEVEVLTPYPNPFTNQVNINIGLPQAGKEYKVRVAIYNTMGKQVATLTNPAMDAGYYVFTWQGNNDSGQEVPDGIYAYRVIVNGEVNKTITGKVIKN